MNSQSAQDNQEIERLLAGLYGAAGEAQVERFQTLFEATQLRARPHTTNERDVILIAYPDHVQQDGQMPLAVLREFAIEHLKDIVTTIHILPHYPWTSDDGFAVSDYMAVDPAWGTWQDIDELSTSFNVMLDGVFNHTSTAHEWFKKYLLDEVEYKNYYIDLDKDTDVSSVVRPRTTPLLTEFQTPNGVKHVWTTFSSDQADLNFANPDVLYEITKVIIEYARHGATLLRLDAIAFAWKELGTNSIHHPKTHLTVEFMREALRRVAPWVQLVTETNVPHKENVSYFGDGYNEAHMVYNFALPPLVVHTLQTGNATRLTNWANSLETPSRETHFFNFTASHDGVGVRAVEGILSKHEIDAMCQQITARGGRLSMKTGADESTQVYEMNCCFFDAVAHPEADLQIQIDQFLCSQAIALSLQGVPGIYLHSLLGSRNWQEGVAQTGRNRTINRQKFMRNELEQELEDATSIRARVFTQYSALLRLRKTLPVFHPAAAQEVHDFGATIFAVKRTTGDGVALLALHNVSGQEVECPLDGTWTDRIKEKKYTEVVTLHPYQVVWLMQG